MMQALDTPAKSRPLPDDALFEDKNPYPADDLDFIWRTVSGVSEEADNHRTRIAPESHWVTFIVAPLLALIRQLSCFRDPDGRPQLQIINM